MAGLSPSDRVRSGDDVDIRVDIQRGLSGCLLPASITRLLGLLRGSLLNLPIFILLLG